MVARGRLLLRCCAFAAAATAAFGGAPATAESPEPATQADARPRLDPYGDLRLREENNFGDRDARSTERGQARVRFGARYALADPLTFAARGTVLQNSRLLGLSETASNLIDSTQLRLDYAYLRFRHDELTVYAGRFPNPFFRTELQLVWDNEFNPQGAAASYRLIDAADARPGVQVTVLYYPLQFDWIGRHSTLSGIQWLLDRPSAGSHYRLGVSYFDYDLHGEPNVASDDFVAGNVIAPGRGYVSDFRLLDLIGDVACEPWGEAWPLQIVGNYVRNLGAASGADTAYAVDVYLGRLRDSHDWRLEYAYARAETDAVFVAFSQDNTAIATNYRWHSLGVEYLLNDHVVLSGMWYRYRPNAARDAGPDDPADWLNRVRFEVTVSF